MRQAKRLRRPSWHAPISLIGHSKSIQSPIWLSARRREGWLRPRHSQAKTLAFPRWARDGRTGDQPRPAHRRPKTSMKNDQILAQISEFCRQADMAETTFGRRA